MLDGTEPIERDEVLYRRISEKSGYYQPTRSPKFSPRVLHPNNGDGDGISLYRSKYVTPEQVGKAGKQNQVYWVISFLAASFQDQGLSIQPSADEPLPGHVVIPEMRFDRLASLKELALSLREKSLEIYGPFTGETL